MILFKEKKSIVSVEINTTLGKVWDFFANMEANYKLWHPEDHIRCRWIKGRPHEVGSIVYAEEMLGKRLCKIKMRCVNVDIYNRIDYKSLFPLSIFHPKSIYLFDNKNGKTVFTAINYFRVPFLFGGFINSLVNITEKHIIEEGNNLKELLESNSI